MKLFIATYFCDSISKYLKEQTSDYSKEELDATYWRLTEVLDELKIEYIIDDWCELIIDNKQLLKTYKNLGYKICCIGKDISEALKMRDIEHHLLPHPRNRQIQCEYQEHITKALSKL
jgi:hypothetical protein